MYAGVPRTWPMAVTSVASVNVDPTTFAIPKSITFGSG
jgi:hypothetical protein